MEYIKANHREMGKTRDQNWLKELMKEAEKRGYTGAREIRAFCDGAIHAENSSRNQCPMCRKNLTDGECITPCCGAVKKTN